MRHRALVIGAALFALILSSATAVADECLGNKDPIFTAGGNVFGRLAGQWNLYFKSKVDADGGTLCNPKLTGELHLAPGSIANDTLAHSSFTLGTTLITLGDTVPTLAGISFTDITFDSPTINNPTISGGTYTNLGTPVNGGDAANKAYVDSVTSGLAPQTAVDYATAAVLPNSPTYSNGTLGVGATLTAGSNTTLTVDGSVVPLNARVLVKTQAAPAQNGAYSLTTAGGGVPWVLTRVTDWDTSAEMKASSYFFVASGTTNTATGWFMSSAGGPVVGTDPISFQQFSASQAYTAGGGVKLVGNAFSLDSPTGTGVPVLNIGPTITALPGVGIRDTSAAFDLTIAATSSTPLTAGRTLTLDVVNASRTVKLGSNLTIATDPGGVTGALKSNGSGTFAQAAASDLSNGTTGSGSVVLATSPTIASPTFTGTVAGNGTIPNAVLVNSSMTIAGHLVSLGGTQAITCADISGATGCSTTVGTMATQNANAVAITGGTIVGLTGLAIRDTSAAFDLTLAATSSGALTAGRTLTFNVVNAARTVKLGANLTIATDPGGVTGALKSNGTGTFAQAAASDLSNGTTGSGAVVLATSPTIASPTFTGTVAGAGTIPNSVLVNSSMTIAGHLVALGGTQAIACADLSNGATGCSTAIGVSGGTIPLLSGTNTWSGPQSFNSGDLILKGASSGTLTLNAAATAGSNTLTLPAGTTDFSATGGTSQVVKQTSSGGAFTVAQLAASDLSNGTTGSGAVVLATSPTIASPTFTGTVAGAGTIPNSVLVNSSMTIAGHLVALGGTQAIACGDLSNGATGCSTTVGTMATQNASAVAITGGTITNASVTGLPTPSLASDAATKSYVDSAGAGISPGAFTPVDYTTTTVLPNSPTYSNGTAGVGATLTAGSNTTLTIDGTLITSGKIVLVKNQASSLQNGAYSLTTAGGGVPWVLTRITTWDQSAEMLSHSYFFVSANATGWFLSTAGTPVVGTDPISFTQFSASSTYTASGGIQLIGSDFSLVNTSITIAGHLVSLGGTQTLSAADLTNGTTGTAGTAIVLATAPAIVGGSHTALTSLGLRDTSAAFDLTLTATSSSALTAGRTLTLDVVNAARTIKLGANLTIASDPGGVTGALKANGTGTFAQAACGDLSNGASGCSTVVGTMATQAASAVAITGGTIAGLTGLAVRDTSAAFDLTIAGTSSSALTAGRTLTFDVVNAARTLKLGANLTIATDPGGVTGALKSNGTGTFAQAACADLSNGATGCSTATGTSGATIPLLNGTNTWSGVQSFNSGDLVLKGATSGTITLNAATAAGSNTLTLPAGTTNFSATGGTSQVVKQTSAGGALTVAQLAASDLSNGTTGTAGTAVVLATGPTINNATFTGTVTGIPGARQPKLVNVRDYGAVGDGSTSDDTAITNAVAALTNNSVLYFPASSGCYVVNTASPFTISVAPLVIKGDGKVASSICKNKFTGDLFALTGGNWIEVRDLAVTGIVASLASYTSGYAFDFTNAGESYVDNVSISYIFGGVVFANSSAIDGRVTNFNMGHFVERGIWYAAYGGGGLVSNGEILFTGTGAEAGSICITISEGDTFHLKHINCAFQGAIGIQLQPPAGKILRNVFMDSVLADSGHSDGIVINGSFTTTGLMQRFYLNSSWASTNLGSGIHLINVQDVHLTDVHAMTNLERGVFVDANVEGLRILGGEFGGNSGGTYLPAFNFLSDDIYIAAGTSDFSVQNIKAGKVAGLTQTSRWALAIENGASNNYTVTGNNVAAGGGGGGFFDGGTGATRVVMDNIGSDNFMPTVASANNLYLGNTDVKAGFVSGTTNIKNIFIGTSGSVPCWVGQRLTIIPTGAFSLGDGTGNVVSTGSPVVWNGICDGATWRFN